MSPLVLTINVDSANHRQLNADLHARLTGSPTKSPEDLAAEIKVHAQRTEMLRQAHLNAVRDRAARETQRAQEALARKLRLAANRVEKVQQKIDDAETKSSAKKEATEAERQARKIRREALALAVAEARKDAQDARAMRQAALLQAEKSASAKHAHKIHEVKDRGAQAVKHAFAVAQAHKEKQALTAAKLGEALTSRLNAAETRRELLASPASSPPTRRALYRVLNDVKVNAETRKLAFETAMTKAAENRDVHIAHVQGKAQAENAKAAAVAAKVKAVASGTDEETAAATATARSNMYERLMRAEVARFEKLRAKYSKSKVNANSVIIVRLDDVLTPRAPPAGLAQRLAQKATTLMATAASRQAGAAARRTAFKHERIVNAATASARRAAALSREGRAHALLTAKVKARATNAECMYAMEQGKRARVLEAEKRRIAKVEKNREQAAIELQTLGALQSKRHAAADERRAKKLRTIAKSGVAAVRLAAFNSRREAMSKAIGSRGMALSARCAAATAKRASILEARVALARKRMVAKHQKREVIEITPAKVDADDDGFGSGSEPSWVDVTEEAEGSSMWA